MVKDLVSIKEHNFNTSEGLAEQKEQLGRKLTF